MAAPKGNSGYVSSRGKPALQRFAEKCAFDPHTGCVMWIGAQTAGRGHNEPYGSFWFEGESWFAHRWAAMHIHGHDITGKQVDHCCPFGPSTLCVEHVKPESTEVNRQLQHLRPGRAFQDLATKQYWLFVHIGIEKLPERFRIEKPADIPFADPGDFEEFEPPEWLRPYLGERK